MSESFQLRINIECDTWGSQVSSWGVFQSGFTGYIQLRGFSGEGVLGLVLELVFKVVIAGGLEMFFGFFVEALLQEFSELFLERFKVQIKRATPSWLRFIILDLKRSKSWLLEAIISNVVKLTAYLLIQGIICL